MTELYKKHRPKRLPRMVGNENTVNSLTNMLERKTLPHTILFHGPSGCGKTTLARIIRRELNCHDMDFQELNCSDFRGIDAVREIARKMNLSPTVEGSCRIWLLDEVHQTTKDAQHAMLKMLEDTPSHVYFLLCTTEPKKLLKTIRTRCCDMPVRLMTHDELEGLLKRTAKRSKIELSKEVLDEIVDASQGTPRTALVLLDKISNLSGEDQIKSIQDKIAEDNEAIELCRMLIKKESWSKVTNVLKNLKGDPESIRYSVMMYARAVLLNKSDYQAYLIITCFQDNFYDSKSAGLLRACYECIFGDEK